MPRRVTLVLCSPAGRPLGTLPPLEVGSPWWPDVEPVVAAARERFGVDGTVLRLLEATSGRTGGGDGAYLAEVRAQGAPDAALGPRVPGVLRPLGDGDPLLLLAGQEDALRLPWARPGGVAAELAWADARLAEAGVPRPGTAVQVKSWNLSSVLRLPTATGVFWCKSVPPFLAHEGGILVTVARSDPDLVPPVLARRRGPGGTVLTPS